MPYRCPASGCSCSFSTPKGLNAHLQNATSCKWYKAGKCHELDTEDGSMNQDSMEDLSNAIVDEVDDELFQLIPLNPPGEQRLHYLYIGRGRAHSNIYQANGWMLTRALWT